jgi:DNA-binding IclR family transcriptional regulator
MQAMADRFGGSVFLALPDGLELIVVEACRPRAAMLTSRVDVGSRVPMPNSALGRAYLAALPPAERAPLIESLRLARGSEWPALSAGLPDALDEHARHGWCLSQGAFHREINSVAAALVGPRGNFMAFSCGGAAFQFGGARLREEIAPALVQLVQQVADAIGGRAALPEAAAA